ncbi:ATP-binding protein [Archangium sp.]|uniref:ATP-binding protein n=1 Tax=Archangium sp. TaxID=1872627 RepID=UPI002ED918C5
MRGGATGRLLACLDSFLSEPLRRSSSEELSRCRMLVGANLVLGLIAVVFLAYVPRLQLPPWLGLGVGGLCLTGFSSSLWLLHRGTSTRGAALVLCSILTAGYLISALGSRNPSAGVHPICMMIPVLAMFLLGPRGGLPFVVVGTLGVGLVLPLWQGLVGADLLRAFFAAIFMLGVWGLSWLLVASREQTGAALEQALRTLRDNESKLTSLLENTEDIVCSLDAQGRLIAANSPLQEMYRLLIGLELRPGALLFPEAAPESLRRRWSECAAQVLSGRRVRFEASPSRLKPPRVLDISLNPVLGAEGHVVGMTIFGRDITDRKEAEARLSEMHRGLLDVSRQAGMAEMATGVLHNVGNALNSVNVSVNLLAERLHQSRVAGLSRATDLMARHAADLGAFLSADGRGQQLPVYLQALAVQLRGERDELLEEVHTLQKSVEHIKAVVSMQQAHARFAGVVERLEVRSLLDDALRLHAVNFERQGILVRREYSEVPLVVQVDRHKLLQILLNLLSNARQALLESGRADKHLTIRVERSAAERLRIAVADNGVGIAPEVAPRLFTQGFTTKKDGHGFGLHISALAAAEMDASLSCSSEGRDQGATFTIDLPIAGEESRA